MANNTKTRTTNHNDSTRVDCPLVLVCATDDAYCMPAAAMITSALKNYGGDKSVDLYIIDGGMTEAHQRRIESIAEKFGARVHWIPAPVDLVYNFPVTGYYSEATYYRLLVPELLPHEPKAIYLDIDLIVQEDLSRLWVKDVENIYFLAVQDEGYPFLSSADHLASCPGVIIDENAEYFNAGVLVMNLVKWRESNLAASVLSFVRQQRKYMVCADQDGLNALAQGLWGKLENRWNQCVPTWERDNQVIPSPDGIIHYAGPYKPWMGTATYPSAKEFEKYLYESGWYSSPKWMWYRSTRNVQRVYISTVDHIRKSAKLVRRASSFLRSLLDLTP